MRGQASPEIAGIDVNDATVNLLKTVSPGTIVDLGASDGRYSRELWKHFPDAEYLLVDPLEYPGKWTGANIQWVHKAVFSPGAHSVEFAETPDPFRSGIYDGGGREVPATDLLELIGTRKNVFLKLDTHGVEKEILAPLGKLKDRISAIQIEVYNFHLTGTSPRMGEIHRFIEDRGFRLATLVDALWRGDGCLWQMDFLYLQGTHPVFSREDFFYA